MGSHLPVFAQKGSAIFLFPPFPSTFESAFYQGLNICLQGNLSFVYTIYSLRLPFYSCAYFSIDLSKIEAEI